MVALCTLRTDCKLSFISLSISMCISIRLINIGGENGLMIKSTAPASRPRISDSASFFAVKKIMGMVFSFSSDF
jgi:ABC-type uncharacterized transport system permease subunit